MLARLEPRDAAHARHVEQDAAADQPVLEDVDRTRLAVEERAVERPRGRRRRCACARRCGSRRPRSPWRIGPIPTRCRRRSASSCDGRRASGRRCWPSVRSGWLSVTVTPVSTSRGRGGDPSRGEVVQGPSPPVVVPAAPIGDGVEELAELTLGHVHGRHGRHRREARPTPNHLIRVMPHGAPRRKIGLRRNRRPLPTERPAP